MTTERDGTTPTSSEREPRSSAVWLLRALLWLGVLVGLVAAGFLVSRAFRQPSPEAEIPDLPDLGAVAEAGAWATAMVASMVALPLLIALRRPRPWLARTGLVIVTLLWAAVSTALWIDVRGNWDCAEMTPSIFVAPLWLAGIAVLASSPAGRRALGLPHGPLVLGVRFLVLGVLAGLVAGNGVCLVGCEQPGDAVIAQLRIGQSREEALALLDTVCEQGRRFPDDDMRFLCAPRGSAACACAPAPAREVRLTIGRGDRVERLTSQTVLGAMRRPR